MSKYLSTELFDQLASHLEDLQLSLAMPESQSIFLKAGKPNQAITDANSQLAQLFSSKASLHRHFDAFITVLEKLPLGIVAVDERGHISFYNAAAQAMVGVDSINLSIDHWPSRFRLYPDDKSTTPCSVESLPVTRALRKLEQASETVYALSPTMKEGKWLKVTAYPLNSNKILSGAICIFEDVTKNQLEAHIENHLQPYVENEKRAVDYLVNANEAFVAFDNSGDITDWNKKAEELLGWTSKDIVGKSLKDTLIPVKHRTSFDKKIERLFAKAKEEGTIPSAVLPALHRDGRELVLEVSASCLDHDDPVIFAFVKDVTQSKKVEQLRNTRYDVTIALANSIGIRAALSKLLKTITEGLGFQLSLLWHFDHRSSVLRCSEGWHSDSATLAAFAVRNKEMTIPPGMGVVGGVFKNIQPGWSKDISLQTGDAQRELAATAGLRCSLAFPILVHGRVEAVMQLFREDKKESDPETLNLLAEVGRQIGQFIEGKKAEDERRRLVAIVEASDDAMLGLSLNGVLTSWNRGASKVYGYKSEDVIGKEIEILSSKDRLEEIRAAMAKVVKKAETQHLETQHLMSDQKLIDVALTLSPILDNEGKVISLCLTARDISEKKQKEQKIESLNASLEQQVEEFARVNDELDTISRRFLHKRDEAVAALRFKTEFLARMNREVRTPLNAIMGLSEMLTKAGLRGQAQEYANIILESGTLLLNVFEDILEYSRLEDGEQTLALEDFSLTAAIEDTIDLVSGQAKRRKLSVVSYIAPEIPALLRGDAKKVKSVLTKLLESTFKYMERGGVIVRAVLDRSSETNKDDHLVKIVFSEAGVGLSAVSRAQVQKPFTLSNEEHFDGTNLGLSVTKHLVESMGGTIGVEPNHAGSGASFWVVIPLGKPATKIEETHPADKFPDRKMLVVDGPAGASRVVHDYCEALGIKCDWVLTGEEAVSALRRHARANTPYDIVFLESVAFGISGPLLGREIRRMPELRAIDVMLYAPFMEEKELAGLSENISTIIRGPLKQSQALAAIVGLLKRRPVSDSKSLSNNSTGLVLVAEDNYINRKVTSAQLGSLGISCHMVVNGREAVEAASRNNYALIFMDCEMPEMDGFTATGEIRKQELAQGKRTPIVAMTANAIAGDREQCINASMDDYLSKPVETDDIEDMIRKWVPKRILKGNFGSDEQRGLDDSAVLNENGRFSGVVEARSQRAGNKWKQLLESHRQETAPSDNGADDHFTFDESVLATESVSNSASDQEDRESTSDGEEDQLDYDRLRTICGEEGMPEIIGEFLSSVQVLMKDLENAIVSQDDVARRKIAHELTGSCSAIGAKQLRELSLTIQTLDNDSWDQNKAIMSALKRSFRSLKHSLQSIESNV
jgi:PAS domain S-box-containing protein